MLCDVCKVHEARIHMESEGDFCHDCHNARIAKLYRYDRLEQFAREIIVHDASNRPHRFSITNLFMPHFSEWTDEEVDDGYQFSVMVKPEDDQAAALFRLHRKVITGLHHKRYSFKTANFYSLMLYRQSTDNTLSMRWVAVVLNAIERQNVLI